MQSRCPLSQRYDGPRDTSVVQGPPPVLGGQLAPGTPRLRKQMAPLCAQRGQREAAKDEKRRGGRRDCLNSKVR